IAKWARDIIFHLIFINIIDLFEPIPYEIERLTVLISNLKSQMENALPISISRSTDRTDSFPQLCTGDCSLAAKIALLSTNSTSSGSSGLEACMAQTRFSTRLGERSIAPSGSMPITDRRSSSSPSTSSRCKDQVEAKQRQKVQPARSSTR